jgi:DNA-binding GntR family transcriptional regulator
MGRPPLRKAHRDAPRVMDRQSDQAFSRLYDAIVRCQLAPGVIVSEPQLQQTFGFSRVALRVAVDRLAQMSLIMPLHRRGYQVAPITLRDVRNTFALRLLVEPPTARTAIGRVDLDRLRKINDRILKPLKPGDPSRVAEVIDANREFHLLIAATSNNDKIVSLIEHLLRDIDRIYYFGLATDPRFTNMQSDHNALIDAMTRGDADRAELISRSHIEVGTQIAMDAILNSSDIADISIGTINTHPAKSGIAGGRESAKKRPRGTSA